MIIKLQNVVTKTSLGTVILQIDRDEIVSVEPHEIIKNGLGIMDTFAPIGYFGDGAFTNLMKFVIKIKLINDIINIEFSDITFRDQAIEYIYDTMIINTFDNNKFYKRNINKQKRNK